MERNELISRLKRLSAETGIAASAASMRAGLGKDYIRDIFRGKVMRPSAEHLRTLAEKGFGRSGGYLLMTESQEPEGLAETGKPMLDAEYLEFGGILEAGNFREIDAAPGDRKILRLPLPGYALARQRAWEVRGDSMDQLDIREGMYVHAADRETFEDYYRNLRDRDVVIVERLEADNSRHELTAKEMLIYEDRTELHPRSSNAKWQPIVLQRGQKNHNVRIVAIVLEAFKPTIR